MRKTKPEDVRSNFVASLQEVLDFYMTVKVGLKDKDETQLVRNTLLTAATLWESFVNDLFIAYINRNATQFIVHLENALKANRTQKQDAIISNFVTVSYPNHMTIELITDLIDSGGNNLTFASYAALKKGAETFLTSGHRDGIKKLSGAQKATLDLWIALRNHIAHDSQRSYNAMNAAMSSGGLHNTGLGRGVRKVTHVGAYLKAKPAQNMNPRIELILDKMKVVSALL